ncbi:MAG: D-2-hydroxyacid dehydrogenase, partial [Negativicoccus succinicivorans]|nr:D-2-hydroxyacid dehydrogenase [Negativicoccus succinicivorans]
MPKLVVLNHLTPERLERLQQVRPDATVEAYAKMSEALPHLEDADAVALWGSMDPLPVLEAAPKLRWLHSMSAGIEKLLPPPMQQNNIVLTHTAAIHD